MSQFALDPDRLVAALEFAAHAHKGQPWAGDPELPYLTHVGSVALEVLAALAVEPAHDAELSVVCAILHDSIEDNEAVDWEAVAEDFGPEVADGVAALSKRPDLPKDQAMADSLERIQQQPPAVWRVKLADRIANLRPPPVDWSELKVARYRAEARDILEALGEASPVLAARLQKKIAAY